MSPLDLAFVPAVLGVLFGWFYGWKAYANLSELGLRYPTRAAFFIFAGPEYFTEAGWRYRNRSWKVAVGGGLLSILLASFV